MIVSPAGLETVLARLSSYLPDPIQGRRPMEMKVGNG
jgi:hypothetical protein